MFVFSWESEFTRSERKTLVIFPMFSWRHLNLWLATSHETVRSYMRHNSLGPQAVKGTPCVIQLMGGVLRIQWRPFCREVSMKVKAGAPISWLQHDSVGECEECADRMLLWPLTWPPACTKVLMVILGGRSHVCRAKRWFWLMPILKCQVHPVIIEPVFLLSV